MLALKLTKRHIQLILKSYFPRVKQLEPEIDHTSPSGTQVQIAKYFEYDNEMCEFQTREGTYSFGAEHLHITGGAT